jgi:hypothetical protein
MTSLGRTEGRQEVRDGSLAGTHPALNFLRMLRKVGLMEIAGFVRLGPPGQVRW